MVGIRSVLDPATVDQPPLPVDIGPLQPDQFTRPEAVNVAEQNHKRIPKSAHASIGMAKFFMGRGAETEAHVREAFRLSPRDTGAFRWMLFVGLAKLQLSAAAEAVVWLRQVSRPTPT